MSEQLTRIIESTQVDKTTAQKTLEMFKPMFDQAATYEALVKSIVVTDVTQVDEMAKARKLRLDIRKIRTGAEKARMEMKANAVAEGKLIDSVASVIKSLVEPMENHLVAQEEFKERKEAAEKAALLAKRTEILTAAGFQRDMSWPKIEELTEDQFNAFYQTQMNMKLAAAKAEQERQAKIKEEQEEAARQRAENEKLRLDNERLQREKAEEERKRKVAEAARYENSSPKPSPVAATGGITGEDRDKRAFAQFLIELPNAASWLNDMKTEAGHNLSRQVFVLLKKVEDFIKQSRVMQ